MCTAGLPQWNWTFRLVKMWQVSRRERLKENSDYRSNNFSHPTLITASSCMFRTKESSQTFRIKRKIVLILGSLKVTVIVSKQRCALITWRRGWASQSPCSCFDSATAIGCKAKRRRGSHLHAYTVKTCIRNRDSHFARGSFSLIAQRDITREVCFMGNV